MNKWSHLILASNTESWVRISLHEAHTSHIGYSDTFHISGLKRETLLPFSNGGLCRGSQLSLNLPCHLLLPCNSLSVIWAICILSFLFLYPGKLCCPKDREGKPTGWEPGLVQGKQSRQQGFDGVFPTQLGKLQWLKKVLGVFFILSGNFGTLVWKPVWYSVQTVTPLDRLKDSCDILFWLNGCEILHRMYGTMKRLSPG